MAVNEMNRPDNLKWCMESRNPDSYRLARKPSGEMVLQGAFSWTGVSGDGFSCGGFEWRDIPIVDLPE